LNQKWLSWDDKCLFNSILESNSSTQQSHTQILEVIFSNDFLYLSMGIKSLQYGHFLLYMQWKFNEWFAIPFSQFVQILVLNSHSVFKWVKYFHEFPLKYKIIIQ
jgi:hypothetical protein